MYDQNKGLGAAMQASFSEGLARDANSSVADLEKRVALLEAALGLINSRKGI